MIQPILSVKLDDNRRIYEPGETLRGTYRVHGLQTEEISAIEISVLWHTDGKGDEDLAVHYFERFSPDEPGQPGPEDPHRFETRLPESPLSYDGLIVKVAWCVRLRVFLRRGKELVEEQPFRLGRVPVAQEVLL